MAGLQETVWNRLEEFRSAVASGVFGAGRGESFSQALLSKAERTETTLDSLQKKFAELAVKQAEVSDFKKQLEDMGRRLADKAEQSVLDRLQQECSRKAEIEDYNQLASKADAAHVSAARAISHSEVQQLMAGLHETVWNR